MHKCAYDNIKTIYTAKIYYKNQKEGKVEK